MSDEDQEVLLARYAALGSAGQDVILERVRAVLRAAYPLTLVGMAPEPDYKRGWDSAIQYVASELGLVLDDPVVPAVAVDDEERAMMRHFLRQTMHHISEERWCAGWLVDLEYILWREVLAYKAAGEPPHTTLGWLEGARELAFLSYRAGGWWRWSPEQKDEVFVPMAEWEQLYAAHEQERQREVKREEP
jgi:hypothetical protein